MIIKKAEFVKSMKSKSDYPSLSLPEIAIAGRSNAGKSSLINCLTNNSKLARVSKEAGKTRLINFFKMNDRFFLVDLPGYGFAKVSKDLKGSWDEMMGGYFTMSKNLKAVLILMDIRHAPNSYDKHMIAYLQMLSCPFIIVATKADKISKARRKQHTDMIMKELNIQAGIHIIPFSSLDKTGKQELLDVIEEHLIVESEELE